MDDKAIRAALLTAKNVKPVAAAGFDSAAQNIADYVAELLREGRASEVTNDLMAQADPQRLWMHYKNGNTGMDLPMDKDSRMARAAQMGLTEDTIHGTLTSKDFKSFKGEGRLGQENYVAPNTEDGRKLAAQFSTADQGRILPLRTPKPMDTRNLDDRLRFEQMMDDKNRLDDFRMKGGYRASGLPGWGDQWAIDTANEAGEKALRLHERDWVDSTAVFDPRNMRSQFARFDPRLSHLSDLNAATGGAILDKRHHQEAVERAQGQIAPSKYLPGVPRQVHADGGVADDDNQPIDLGAAREQKQVQTFHKGMMSDISNAMSERMEAHQKAVDAGVFDGYELGDVLRGNAGPMKITGRFVRQWKPTRMTLEHFDRMGAKPTIIEHNGKQYVPMLRYQTGKEGTDDWQEGDAYLDGVKAAGYPKMGMLRSVKAKGGAVDDARVRFLSGNHPEVPDVVYHGTKADFRSFLPLSHFGTMKAAHDRLNPDQEDWNAPPRFGGDTRNIIPAHISLKKPLDLGVEKGAGGDGEWFAPSDMVWQAAQALRHNGKKAHAERIEDLMDGLIDAENDKEDLTPHLRKVADVLRDAGHDGLIYTNKVEDAGSRSFVPLGPEQVKSAISARQFDPSNPDMTFADGGAVDDDDDGITAYHGSPHDFDEFDISKIGTGEGAQAYGHGLYFAGNEGVANSYRDTLAPQAAIKQAVTSGDFDDPRWRAASAVVQQGGEDKALSILRDNVSRGHARSQQVIDAILDGSYKSINLPKGHMYKVKLRVKPHELLDWDAPLEQQPAWQKVRQHWDETKGDPDIIADRLGLNDKSTGRSLHDALVGNDGHTGQVRAAAALLEAGIKGIRYRDAGSRNMADGDPTHNYVMFHHAPVKVVDKYAIGGYVPQKTQKAYKLFRTKGDGKLYPLFVHADKPVPMGQWLEAEEGPQGKAQGKVKSKLGDLAYRPGWHAGDLPIATHIGGKSDPSLKKPDYRPDNHVWAEVEMAADKDWQSEADSRGKGVKAHITDQVPLRGFYRYKTNPNMTGNWLIGGHMKVNRVLSDDEVKQINDAAGTADLPRLQRADGGIVDRSPMFEGMSEHLMDDDGKPMELWHGTPGQPFEAFDDKKIGVRDPGFYGRGHYLTPDRGGAEAYADPDEMGRGSVMGPLHAALKNPYVWDVSDEDKAHRTLRDLQSMGIMRGQGKLESWDNLQRHHIDPFMAEMQRRGHDGVIYKTHRGPQEIVVFNPNMIKHRDAEVGDPNDPRIMRKSGGAVDKALNLTRRK